MFKNIDIWLSQYIRQSSKRLDLKKVKAPLDVIFCFVDHFEPDWNNAPMDVERKRVEKWIVDYPRIARRHKDADGHPPKHTFFYPAEVYNEEHLNQLKKLCDQNLAEVEIHLHHDADTAEGFRKKLIQAKADFSRHGFLGKDKRAGEIRFAFIHGNWALNNSRNDGKWCGVNNESKILKEEGCYADFTLPSAPSDTQTEKINSLYYTTGNDHKPKSHNSGVDVEVGRKPTGDLMMIQGPLALNFKSRKWGILPRIENSDVAQNQPASEERIDLWVKQNIHVQGRPEWIFIKVHTHGAPENNADSLFNSSFEKLFSTLEKKYNDRKKFFLHYVTAREMFNIIKAAEEGKKGSPGDYRDFLIQ